MKTAKLVIGIISIVLSLMVIFQSCAASLGEAMANSEEISGATGIFVAMLMIAAGIVAIAGRKSKGAAIACVILYGIAAILGLTASGIFKDLMIWGGLCAIFAIFFLVSVIMQKKSQPNTPQ